MNLAGGWVRWHAAGALGGQGPQFSRAAPLVWLWEVKQDGEAHAADPNPVACQGRGDRPLGSWGQARGTCEDSAGPARPRKPHCPQ